MNQSCHRSNKFTRDFFQNTFKAMGSIPMMAHVLAWGQLQNSTGGTPAVLSASGQLSLFRTTATTWNRTEPLVHQGLGVEVVLYHVSVNNSDTVATLHLLCEIPPDSILSGSSHPSVARCSQLHRFYNVRLYNFIVNKFIMSLTYF